MADRWMDERDRRNRERDWRQSEDTGRGRDQYGSREDRSFGAQRSGPDRDRVFGEQESGFSYSRQPTPGGYRASSQGGPQGGYGGGRDQEGRFEDRGYGQHEHGGDWQGRNYQGVSPAMAHGEYDLERNQPHGRQGRGQAGGPGAMRFQGQDYTQGGRFYGDDRQQPIYRQEWGQGGVDYTNAPRGYDADQQGGYGRQQQQYGRPQQYGGQPQPPQYGQGYGGGRQDYQPQPARGGMASGGTGGYDFERGYGDAGRQDMRGGGWQDHERHDGERGGDFFFKAGQKVANWFKGNDLMQGSRPDDDRSFQTDFGRERRYMPEDRGHRGVGPKGYKRSDERISEEVHERLTDDSWLDASHIDVHVKDGEVTLTGSVESREAKHRAERLVEDLSGVQHVQNNLRVMASNPLTGSGRGFGDSVAEAQMSREQPAPNPAASDGGSTMPTGQGGTNGTQDSASTRTTTRRT